MAEPIPRFSWFSEKTEVRPSPIHGRGLFATDDFEQNEFAAVKGGHIIDRERLREVSAQLGAVEIQIADDLFIAPVTAAEREGSMLYTNHSCDPNLGLRGNIVFVARRAISSGEELTHDWCMTDNDTYEVECRCGSPHCRHFLRGKDWQRRDLQRRYIGYFSTYLAEKMTKTSL